MFSRPDGARTTEPAEHGSSFESRLTREQVVDRIIQVNPTATERFLNQFGKEKLEKYLAHLDAASRPRGREAIWPRPGDSPAILTRSASV